MKTRRSRWREQSYVFRELEAALNPPITLGQTIRQWPMIRQGLANEPRKRMPIKLG